jgi:uncharacterized membrane protein YoaT (DUF817 family)
MTARRDDEGEGMAAVKVEAPSPTATPALFHETGPYLEPLRRAIRSGLARLPAPLAEFVLFGLKQAWACLFGAIMLALLIVTKAVWQPDWAVHRYDALFVMALAIQGLFLVYKLESLEEAKVIFVYHVVGTAMEIFKTAMGSWVYPEEALIRIGGVPLFSGFMYACVGSYMARAIRIFDMRFTNYPPYWATLVLAVAIYLNFFVHHYWWDFRWVLFAATVVLFGRVRIYYTVDVIPRWMPLILAAILTGLFMWIAENIGTYTGTWLYPGQTVWKPVSFAKFGSWYLLLFVSFVLVTLVSKPRDIDR